ncbi:MAG: hypothetical protein JWR25_253 [Noviherbaspirillum sp.]|nr:hypothetical protein [Noviherbaspirillum sp.]MDB5793874.1 hypothetical protein [Noviherbaspirillum sp.]
MPPEGVVPTVLPELAELAPGAVAPEPMDDPVLGEAELPDISLELLDEAAPVELPVEELDLMPLSIEPQAESVRAHAKGIIHLIIRFS